MSCSAMSPRTGSDGDHRVVERSERRAIPRTSRRTSRPLPRRCGAAFLRPCGPSSRPRWTSVRSKQRLTLAIRVLEIDGLAQARRLADVEKMGQEVIAVTPDRARRR
jgi:hypothetical protein